MGPWNVDNNNERQLEIQYKISSKIGHWNEQMKWANERGIKQANDNRFKQIVIKYQDPA